MKKKLIIAAVVLAIAGVAAFVLLDRMNHEDEGALVVSGNVEATEVDIGFRMPGRVEALMADEGDIVVKGSKLASIDSRQAASEVARARANLREARVRLEELKSGSRPQELKQADAEVDFAGAELAKAKKDFERSEMLYSNGAIAAAQHDAYARAFDTGKARYDAALQKRSLVAEGPRNEDIRAAGFRVEQAEAALQGSLAALEDASVYSPIDGVVLSRNSEVGETVAAGSPVYTIGDLESPWIKVYVREASLGMVKLGQKAEITTDSYPGKVYDGTVSRISSEAEFTPRNVQTLEERVKLVFGVEVRVSNLDGELKPGMPADVRILIK